MKRRRRRRTKRNPPGFFGQVAIGVVSAIVVAIVIEIWREQRSRAPLPAPPAGGLTEV